MKNVLIIANNGMNNSGVPSVICQVIESQYKKCRITLVVFNDDDYYYPFLKDRGVDILKINLNIPDSSAKKIKWYFFDYPRMMEKEISNIIINKKIDIIHSFKEEDGWPFLKAAKKLGVKTRIAHCNNEFRKRKSLLPKILANRNRRKLLHYSNCNVGACEKCCVLMFKNRPYFIIYNSYDESKFNNKVKNTLTNKLVLTQVATFSSRKNQLFSVDIVELLIKRGVDCFLNLVGFPAEDRYFFEMRKKIKEKDLQKYISIIDGKNGIGDVFEKTTFLILPSVSEAAPIVLVDAQACGIKCFASDTITKEMDCGGVDFLPINKGTEVWADAIKETFVTNANNRTTYNMDKFCSKTFSNSIDRLYKL